jgi:hypothetical protein
LYKMARALYLSVSQGSTVQEDGGISLIIIQVSLFLLELAAHKLLIKEFLLIWPSWVQVIELRSNLIFCMLCATLWINFHTQYTLSMATLQCTAIQIADIQQVDSTK